jgi:uncharacterized protein (DUF169 family)
MSDTIDYTEIASKLTDLLSLRQTPVAVSFAELPPENVKEYTGRVPAGCRFWQEAATSSFVTTSADHQLCAIGMYTHNLESTPAQQTDLMSALKVFESLGYVRQEDLALIPVLQQKPKHVVYSPLTETSLPPDVVLLFVDSRQALILSEAAQQVELDNFPAMGRPACAVVPQAVNSGRAALSLGCCGARAYLDDFADDIAIFAIPGKKIDAYTRRVEALAQANAVLSKFHQTRRGQVAAGGSPSIEASLSAMQAV